uniref:ATP synthase complex subunit 8 n=1 Tax=Pseudotrapelus sinaitus TaxID=118229 RepID=D1MV78_9SAUR|nr:ATP synthase F0 subunit 8 [Pseudotrapelus sinaitus]BAI52992.1 ATPase subunit 8 [Pseudotrapelus sinaitus]
MPQLDTTYWLQMLVFTWAALLTTLSKTTNTEFTAKPTKKTTKTKTPTSPW